MTIADEPEQLVPEDFDAFFSAVHHVTPFPWQRRLAAEVCATGWREQLDVPTSAGKTSAIDVAVFNLALELSRRPPGATNALAAHLRIFFVVDRRLVVDEAFNRAKIIACALWKASARGDRAARGEGPKRPRGRNVLRWVAQALGHFAGTDVPLRVARLRGGVPRDSDWVRTPTQPTVVVSTVDQVGSRLFFRGYGVSQSMRPVHAGLLGTDALYLLDEAHLSQPFVQTLTSSRDYQRPGHWSEDRAASSLEVVSLSATQVPGSAADRAVSSVSLVQDDDYQDEVLGPRLTGSKLAELHLVKPKSDQAGFAQEFVDRAWELSCPSVERERTHVVAVVVNRVHRARTVFEKLRERASASEGPEAPDVALLTGRTREIEREQVLQDLLPRMKRPRPAAAKPLIIVATQCVEAGADLDFDALVTEMAPLDCLRQRFGRLNRLGRMSEAHAEILAAPDQIKLKGAEDPVYGLAMAHTWAVLDAAAKPKPVNKAHKGEGAVKVLDFGIRAAAAWLPDGQKLSDCLAPRAEAPVLLPAFVRRWCWTSPPPEAEPEVALFLHGPKAGPPDVQVVWRADLVGHSEENHWLERIASCPPVASETISVPRGQVVRWLKGLSPDTALVDVEGQPDSSKADEPGERATVARIVRWRGSEEKSKVITPGRIAGGDLIVVPAVLGGCDEWGWNPVDETPVRDFSREAVLRQRNLSVVRLSPALLHLDWLASKATDPPERFGDSTAQYRARQHAEEFRALLEEIAELKDSQLRDAIKESPLLPDSWKEWLNQGDAPSEWQVRRTVNGLPLALSRRIRKAGDARAHSDVQADAGDATTETEHSSWGSQRAVPLSEHSKGVKELAERFAKPLLPEKIATDVVLAAFLHDVGKAHPKFKRWLYGGDELADLGGPALAKSNRLKLGKRARELAGLPDGARHEVASLAFAQAHSKFMKANDRELVLWLIGTHHGWGRPFFPPIEWPEEGGSIEADLEDEVVKCRAESLASIQARWFDIQQEVTQRYGPWGLARLEAILRLADHRRSELEQEGEGGKKL